MNRYYKDRDFPEVKVSNADIVAVIENPKQLQRVIDEHNSLLDELNYYYNEAKDLRRDRDFLRTGFENSLKTWRHMVNCKILFEGEWKSYYEELWKLLK